MRSSAELIRELQHKAKSSTFTRMALVVAFPQRTEMLFASQSTELEQVVWLEARIHDGGEPVGFLGWKELEPHEGSAWPELLEEHARDESLQVFLRGVGVVFATVIEDLESGRVRV